MSSMPMRCPRCGRQTSIDKGNAFRPFCSARCRDVDLHAWATSQYRIAGEQTPNPQLEDQDREYREEDQKSAPN